jgi:peroxiredoxin
MLRAVGVPAPRGLLGLALALGLGCGGDPPEVAPAAAAPAAAAPAAAPAPPQRDPRERPLPAFEGLTLEGERIRSSALLGRRLVLFFFETRAEAAGPVALGVAAVARLRGRHNFDVVGVGVAGSREDLQRFVESHALGFRVIDDSRGAIARRLGLRYPVALLGVDAEGYLRFALAQFDRDEPDLASAVEGELRGELRLPALGGTLEPVLGVRSAALAFDAERLGGGRLDSRELRGRAAVLIFFLHTCPHCHAALASLRQTLDALPEATRPRLVGISLAGESAAVRDALTEKGLDFFEVVFDPGHEIRNAYGATGGTPDIFLVDAEGSVTARVQGWREERDPPLMRMRVARLAGAPVPMLLHQSGYSGNEFCAVCHDRENASYELTRHSWAFDTLVRHGAERDAECVGCHVVGFGQPGGYRIGTATPDLEDVGCESCHGRGGPHLSPGFVSGGAYASACLACHDAQHSLGFDYATFLPKVSHAAQAHLLALPLPEKRRLLEERARRRPAGLPEDARYVGSEACRSCHPAEFETWAASPHARAVASLASRGQAGKAECLSCHTTAHGRPGGFPGGASADRHPDLARVGCESCHGPGEAHVGPDAARRGTIVSLGDKCDSCVILQICGTCHDEKNDPEFEYRVEEKIERQRHGTIEAGTGRALPAPAGARLPDAALPALLERAFAARAG